MAPPKRAIMSQPTLSSFYFVSKDKNRYCRPARGFSTQTATIYAGNVGDTYCKCHREGLGFLMEIQKMPWQSWWTRQRLALLLNDHVSWTILPKLDEHTFS